MIEQFQNLAWPMQQLNGLPTARKCAGQPINRYRNVFQPLPAESHSFLGMARETAAMATLFPFDQPQVGN